MYNKYDNIRNFYYRYIDANGVKFRYIMHKPGNYEVYVLDIDNFGNEYYKYHTNASKLPIGAYRYSYNPVNYKSRLS